MLSAQEVSIPSRSVQPADPLELQSRLFGSMRNQLSKVPDWSIDPGAMSKKLVGNHLAVIDWVKLTRLLPYRGSLKGAKGVFFEGEGSSLDRALLLSEMLAARDIETRIARFKLTRSQAHRLVDRMADGTRSSGHIYIPAPDQRIPPEDLGLTVQEWSKISNQMSEMLGLAGELREAMFGALKNQLGGFAEEVRHDDPETARARNKREAIDAVSEYWAVEMQDAFGWHTIILDDLGPNSENLEAVETFAPDEIPDNWFHTVSFELSAKSTADGMSISRRLLTHTARAADFDGDTLNLSVLPIRVAPSTEVELDQDFPGDLVDRRSVEMITELMQSESPSYQGVKYWLPVFTTFGGEKIVANAVGIDGREYTRGQLNTLLRSAVRDTPENEQSAQFQGLSLDIVSMFNGEETSRQSRYAVKYNNADKLERAALTSSYAVQNRRYTEDELALRSLQRGVSLSETLQALQSGDGPDDMSASTFCEVCEAYSAVRWSVAKAEDDAFIGVPNITGLKQYHVFDKDGTATGRLTFDIVENVAGVIPSESSDPFAVRFEQGVRDAVTETTLLSLDREAINSTTTAFLDRTKDWIQVGGTEWLRRLDQLAKRSDSSQAMLGMVDQGNVLLAQEKDGMTIGYENWWTLDPKSGSLIGHGRTSEGIAAIWVVPIAAAIAFVGCMAVRYVQSNQIAESDWWSCLATAAFAAVSTFIAISLFGLILPMYGLPPALSLVVSTGLFHGLRSIFSGQLFRALLEWLAELLEQGKDDKPRASEALIVKPARPACIKLSNVNTAVGAAGSIGSDGNVCGLSCTQLTSLGSTALAFCRSHGGSYCNLWNEYYAREIPRCCTGGTPVCR